MIAGLNVQIQDHLQIAAWVPAVGGWVYWGPFHKLGRGVFQQLQGVVLHSSWLVPDYIFVPAVWMVFTQCLKSCGILLAFHYFGGDGGRKDAINA